MVKHPQRIRQLWPTNCLSVFNHFVGLAFKGLTNFRVFLTFVPTLLNFIRFGSPPGSSSWPHLFLEPYFILPCLLFKCMRWNGYFSLYSLFKLLPGRHTSQDHVQLTDYCESLEFFIVRIAWNANVIYSKQLHFYWWKSSNLKHYSY